MGLLPIHKYVGTEGSLMPTTSKLKITMGCCRLRNRVGTPYVKPLWELDS